MRALRSWRRRYAALFDARIIRQSGTFDGEIYLRQTPGISHGADVIRHYLKYGEALGLKPSKDFDPTFYGMTNPDVVASGVSLFAHYLRHGKMEGRASKGPASLSAPELTPAISKSAIDRKRENVIVILHELSRTGAPILGLNIIRRLREEHDVNVIGVSLNDGELRDYLDADATVPIVRNWAAGPWGSEAADLAQRLIEAYAPAYVIANSSSTFALALALRRRGARVVGLVHEFAMFLQGSPGVAEFFAEGDELVFPVELVRSSIGDRFPVVNVRRTRLLPQGQSSIPGASKADSPVAPLPRVREGASFVILGAGSVEWRKGIDLFLATAATLHRRYPNSEARFVWVGSPRPHDPSPESYIIEQAKRSELGDRFALFPATPDLGDVYRSVDAFFVSSRLDPLPNVAIDAASLGLPVVCFDQATGFAEILHGDDVAGALVAPHLDVGAAADIIFRLETDLDWRKKIVNATLKLSKETFDMAAYVTKLHGIGMPTAAPGLRAVRSPSRKVR